MAEDGDVACACPPGATNGPVAGVSYPLVVQYCGECSMPFEYCEYSGRFDACKKWLEKNLPDMFADMYKIAEAAPGDENAADEEKAGGKKQKRGGKGSKPAKAVVAPAPSQQRITVQRSLRGKNKSVTVIKGLTTCDVDLKVASKYFASRFACGSSVTGADEIVIQGDVKDDLFDVIPDKWKTIDEDIIEDLGDVKR